MPPITLWFLQASRSIRIAWLLEELGLDYDVNFFDRTATMKAPEEFKSACGNPLGRAPVIQDGDLIIFESGAITEYLCETYDKSGKLIPQSNTGNPTSAKQRIQIKQYVHAAEATFLLHGLAITYVRWNIPKDAPPSTVPQTEQGLAINVRKDLQWLESELRASKTKFLCGDEVTAADTMMHLSVDFIFKTELGVKKGEGDGMWQAIEKWLANCEASEGYKRAVEKTGHNLEWRMPS